MTTLRTLLNHQSATFAEGSHGFGDGDRMRGRFADRTKRLARRQESDIFRHYLMPVTWILGLAGFLGLAVLWIGEGAQAMTHSPAIPVLVPLFAAPVLTALIRVVRGHFHPAVREL
jgi:hypothetical protein